MLGFRKYLALSVVVATTASLVAGCNQQTKTTSNVETQNSTANSAPKQTSRPDAESAPKIPASPQKNPVLSDPLLGDVPMYPGAKVAKAQKGSATGIMLLLNTPDDLGVVGKFYKEKCEAAGWQETPTTSSIITPTVYILGFTKGNRTLRVTVTQNRTNGSSDIAITVGVNTSPRPSR